VNEGIRDPAREKVGRRRRGGSKGDIEGNQKEGEAKREGSYEAYRGKGQADRGRDVK